VIGAVRGFAAFWLDFVVGDDWRIAAGVLGLVAGGALLVHYAVVRSGAVGIILGAGIVLVTAVSIAFGVRRGEH
jgi:uncharacterized membrane protein HdeD (DUF308 family)